MLSLLEFSDVSDNPQVKMDLPLLRLGDTLTLKFQLERDHQGRHEVLDIQGEFRITSLSNTQEASGYRPLYQIESTGAAPFWKAVKKQPSRPLAPAISFTKLDS